MLRREVCKDVRERGSQEKEEEEEEESLFKADAVDEEDSERDRATQGGGAGVLQAPAEEQRLSEDTRLWGLATPTATKGSLRLLSGEVGRKGRAGWRDVWVGEGRRNHCAV